MCLNHEWWTPKQKLVNPNEAADVAGMQTPQPYFHATFQPIVVLRLGLRRTAWEVGGDLLCTISCANLQCSLAYWRWSDLYTTLELAASLGLCLFSWHIVIVVSPKSLFNLLWEGSDSQIASRLISINCFNGSNKRKFSSIELTSWRTNIQLL
jgi:hypothetical protein